MSKNRSQKFIFFSLSLLGFLTIVGCGNKSSVEAALARKTAQGQKTGPEKNAKGETPSQSATGQNNDSVNSGANISLENSLTFPLSSSPWFLQSGSKSLNCTDAANGRRRVRRLSHDELVATLLDLIGEPAKLLTEKIQADPQPLLYGSGADNLVVGEELLANMHEIAPELAAAAIATEGNQNACLNDPSEDCVRKFFQSYGFKIYRRPLSDAEVLQKMDLYLAASKLTDAKGGLKFALSTFFQSPYFLNRSELGEKVVKPGSVVGLSGYEIASYLSYSLWGTLPDSSLFEAAGKGDLNTSEGIETQVARMIHHANFKRALPQFLTDWLQLRPLLKSRKDATLYPGYTAAVAQSAQQEITEIFNGAALSNSDFIAQLYSPNFTYTNGILDKFYAQRISSSADVPSDNSALIFAKSANAAHRKGLLTTSGLLAAHSYDNESAPFRRAAFVRKQLLCQQLPPPPANQKIVFPQFDPNLTTRERFALHSSSPSCASCHRLLDSIGFGFEAYDATGQFRTVQAGKPIDSSGAFSETFDLNGAFNDVASLGDQFTKSAQSRSCFAVQYYRYLEGRMENSEDRCAVNSSLEGIRQDGVTFQKFLTSVLTGKNFFLRKFE